ncbi:HIT family protein [Streptococcus pluranimalium]|uniref:HIT family protein n=1 Tax=Streptococcus pluranimalium TaxID=82348 RepID=UPI0039FD24A2
MENCIFCQIIKGDIPSAKVYEDDEVMAFLDITQTTTGHTLLIPKKHVRNVLDMTDDIAKEVFARLPKVARAVQKATDACGMNIINNNETIAGQTVFHAHIHLVPRFSDEDGIAITYTTHEPDFQALTQLASHIAKEVV